MDRDSKLEESKQRQQRESIVKAIAHLTAPDGNQNRGLSASEEERYVGPGRDELPTLAARSATFPAFSSAVEIRAEEGRGR